jgi:hypothetical protein
MNPLRSQMATEFLQTFRPKVESADSLIATASSESEEKEDLISEYDQVIPSIPLSSPLTALKDRHRPRQREVSHAAYLQQTCSQHDQDD